MNEGFRVRVWGLGFREHLDLQKSTCDNFVGIALVLLILKVS